MDKECENILQLVEDEKATSEDFANAPLPEKMRAVTVHRDEEHIFDGLTFREKDPRKSLHLDEVPIPELGPGEVLVAVMASAVNFNNVWSSVFEPQSGFAFLGDFSKMRPQNKKHYQDFHMGLLQLAIFSQLHSPFLFLKQVAPAVWNFENADVFEFGGVTAMARLHKQKKGIEDPSAVGRSLFLWCLRCFNKGLSSSLFYWNSMSVYNTALDFMM